MHANDNFSPDELPAWDSVTRIRPSPNEIMALLHLRHEGPRPPTSAQLGAAMPLVIQGERWRGRDGRWRPCESYEQPRGSRRSKPLPTNHARRLGGIVAFPDLSTPPGLPSGDIRIAAAVNASLANTRLRHRLTEGAVTRYPAGTPVCDWLAGSTKPAASHNFIYRRYGAVEDALIALIDASGAVDVANNNVPPRRRRRSRRRIALAA